MTIAEAVGGQLVELDAGETWLAIAVGTERQLAAELKHWRNPLDGIDPAAGWTNHPQGAGAELAVAKALDRYWPPRIGQPGSPDLEGIEVRLALNGRPELIVKPGDADDVTAVLVMGRLPTFAIVGAIRVRDARRPEWHRDRGAHGPAYFVPRAALRPINEVL